MSPGLDVLLEERRQIKREREALLITDVGSAVGYLVEPGVERSSTSRAVPQAVGRREPAPSPNSTVGLPRPNGKAESIKGECLAELLAQAGVSIAAWGRLSAPVDRLD